MSDSPFFIGCHLSVTGGYAQMTRTAISIGATTIQFFTRNPRGGAARDISEEDANEARELLQAHGFGPLVAHAPYTLNPCSAEPKTRDFARRTFADDLKRLQFLPECYYNFHPGSHVGQGIDTGIQLIADMLNQVLDDSQTTPVLLETMAGKGSEVGSRLEELRRIIDLTDQKQRLGVCLDTCHVFDAGYDIASDLDRVLAEFDDIIGLDRLKAIHLNDSLFGFGSHKDRHAVIGGGKLGFGTIATLINHPLLRRLPFLLETPNELDGYAREIAWLKSQRTAPEA